LTFCGIGRRRREHVVVGKGFLVTRIYSRDLCVLERGVGAIRYLAGIFGESNLNVEV